MFPDPTLKWRPFPSMIDGIPAPFVLDRGLWQGVLHLIVLEAGGRRAYGVLAPCQVYGAFEELIYSVSDHGSGGRYNSDVYIKEATTSRLLTDWKEADPMRREARHFLFVGGDFCYEILGFQEPVVIEFASQEEAYAWRPEPERAAVSYVDSLRP